MYVSTPTLFTTTHTVVYYIISFFQTRQLKESQNTKIQMLHHIHYYIYTALSICYRLSSVQQSLLERPPWLQPPKWTLMTGNTFCHSKPFLVAFAYASRLQTPRDYFHYNFISRYLACTLEPEMNYTKLLSGKELRYFFFSVKKLIFL